MPRAKGPEKIAFKVMVTVPTFERLTAKAKGRPVGAYIAEREEQATVVAAKNATGSLHRDTTEPRFKKGGKYVEDRCTRWLERRGYLVKRTEPIPEFEEFGRATADLRRQILQPVERLVAWLARWLPSPPPTPTSDGSPESTKSAAEKTNQ